MRHYFLILFFVASSGVSLAQICDDLYSEKIVESSEVKNQCGTQACWAHPITSALEQKISLERADRITLSEEYLYLKNILNQFYKGMLDKRDSKKGSIVESIEEGTTLDDGFKFGVVPDQVMNSKVISTSKNTFFNKKKALFSRLLKEERQLTTSLAGVTYNKRRTAIEKAVHDIDVEFGNRVDGKWQISADGKERFLFEEKWYTPEEFVELYIFKGKRPFNTLFKYFEKSATPEKILQIVEQKLDAKETIPISVTWEDRPKFSWFHKTFRHKAAAHALEIIGIKKVGDKITSFIFKNSWGEKWGKEGTGEMPVEEFFKTYYSLIEFQANVRFEQSRSMGEIDLYFRGSVEVHG